MAQLVVLAAQVMLVSQVTTELEALAIQVKQDRLVTPVKAEAEAEVAEAPLALDSQVQHRREAVRAAQVDLKT